MDNIVLANLIRSSTAVYYPSAGNDLRDLMILSGIAPKPLPDRRVPPLQWCASCFGGGRLPLPDLFIHGDIHPWNEVWIGIQAGKMIYSDKFTCAVVKELRELPRLELPLCEVQRFVNSPNVKTDEIGRCALMTVEITSDLLGTFKRRLIYVCSVNEVFTAEYLLKQRLQLAGLIHVRYGIGFGGAAGSGSWLKAVMPRLGVKFIFTDREIDYPDRSRAWEAYPELGGMEGSVRYLGAFPENLWSGISDVQLLVTGDGQHCGVPNRVEYVR